MPTNIHRFSLYLANRTSQNVIIDRLNKSKSDYYPTNTTTIYPACFLSQHIVNTYFTQKRFISKDKLRAIVTRKRLLKLKQTMGDEFSEDDFSDQKHSDEFKSHLSPWATTRHEIAHGECVVDRKSVFQGHCAPIQRVEHVELFLAKLKENKKIANAFHNMWAYRVDKSDPNARVGGKSASILQDCDDDGEQAAGGRLLNLLQILNVVNVMVVVTRWYGGTLLGPIRFKHINNAARDALVKGRFVNGPGGGGESSNIHKGKQSKNKR